MTTFDDREAAFENKFAHDETRKFEATARACKRVALWAAEILKKDRTEAEAYAEKLSIRDATTPGHEGFLNHIRQDLAGHVSGNDINIKMEAEIKTAMDEIQQN